VLLSHEHGVVVPIRQDERPLILNPGKISITTLLFDWNSPTNLSEDEKRIRFVINGQIEGRSRINYTIGLKLDTTGNPKAGWVYGNISRFVKDAIKFELNTVSISSSKESLSDEVWLPGCDEPLKVALINPELKISVFNRAVPKQPPAQTSPSTTRPAKTGVAPSVTADH
jgi:hypothetical protein